MESEPAGLHNIGGDRLECGEKRAEEGENETPCGKVVISVRSARTCDRQVGLERRVTEHPGQARDSWTYARPTPAMTGRRVRVFLPEKDFRSKMTDKMMIKSGDDARTT